MVAGINIAIRAETAEVQNSGGDSATSTPPSSVRAVKAWTVAGVRRSAAIMRREQYETTRVTRRRRLTGRAATRLAALPHAHSRTLAPRAARRGAASPRAATPPRRRSATPPTDRHSSPRRTLRSVDILKYHTQFDFKILSNPSKRACRITWIFTEISFKVSCWTDYLRSEWTARVETLTAHALRTLTRGASVSTRISNNKRLCISLSAPKTRRSN